jgi:predicted nucleotidyltransferase
MNDTAIRDFCVERGIELLVLFGSVAGNTERPGSDIDLAVKMKRGRTMAKLELIYHLGALFVDREIDLVVLSLDTDPVLLFEIFSAGKPLYKEKPDIFDSERLRAYKLYYDTEKLRRLQSEYLRNISNGGRHVA